MGTLSNAMHGTPSNSMCMAYKARTQRTSRMKGNIIMLWLVVALVVVGE